MFWGRSNVSAQGTARQRGALTQPDTTWCRHGPHTSFCRSGRAWGKLQGGVPFSHLGLWAGSHNHAGPARRRQEPQGHRPLHNPSADLPSARLVTHGCSRPGPPGKLSGALIWDNCPGERERWDPGARAPRSLALRWGSYCAEKATSVPGDPGAAQVSPRPRPCRGPALSQRTVSVLPAVHTPEEGGGAPKRSRDPLCPSPRGLGPHSGTRRMGGGVLTSGRPWPSGPLGNPMIRLD